MLSCAGTHTFSIVFNGGTYSNSASCADVLDFGLPSNSIQVPVVECTSSPGLPTTDGAQIAQPGQPAPEADAVAPEAAAEAPEAAAVAPTFADATTSAEGLDISPIAATVLSVSLHPAQCSQAFMKRLSEPQMLPWMQI